MSNSPKRVSQALYQGASPRGDVADAYVNLVLQLLESRNAGESNPNPAAECVRQVFALVGQDDLAAKDFAARLNYIRDAYRG